MHYTEFIVEGSWPFPIDMLRHDQAHPATEEDSHKLVRTMDPTLNTGKVTISLGKYHGIKKSPHITEGRWESFGWKVIKVIPKG